MILRSAPWLLAALLTLACGSDDGGGSPSSGGSSGTGGSSGGSGGSGATGGSAGAGGSGGSAGSGGTAGAGGSAGGGSPSAAVAVECGEAQSCTVLGSGKVRCWGWNNSGMLGNGTSQDSLGDQASETPDQNPFTELGSKKALGIAVGDQHACALLEGGAVKCWGNGSGGRLGLGDTKDRGASVAEMGDQLPTVDLGAGFVVTALAAGGDHTCALSSDGNLKCWGNGFYGQLGNGKTDNIGDSPSEMGSGLPVVDVGGKVTAVAAGGSFTCALLDSGDVKCFGLGQQGQLGNEAADPVGDAPGEMGSSLTAVKLGIGVKAKAIGAGDLHACAVTTDGKLKCWGASLAGADPATMGASLPFVDLGGATVAGVSLGQGTTCALLDGGSLRCWGSGSDGENGSGSPNDIGNPISPSGTTLPNVDLGTGVSVKSIASGNHHHCAVDTQGRLKCWGDNIYGQLGLGTPDDIGNDAGEMGDALPFVKL